MRHTITVGSIVTVSQMADPEGRNPKDRPAVVLSLEEDSVLVAAISSRMDVFDEATHVSLPWERSGHPQTGLNRESAAVCFWFETVAKNRIEAKGRSVSAILVKAITARMRAE